MNNVYVPQYLRTNRKVKNQKTCYESKYINSTRVKPGLNQYFSFNGENYDSSSEADLFLDLQEEHIKTIGYNFVYIVRTNNTLDELYGESIGSTFKHAFNIEMVPSSTELMIGRDALSQYGYAMTDTVELHVSYRRITEEIKKLNIPGRTYPLAGDLISWQPLNVGNLLSITYCEDKIIPFLHNYWTMYNLICQVYNLGQETFDTGNEDVDFLNTFTRNYKHDNADNTAIHDESKEIACPEPNLWDINFQKDLHYGK